jgi:hypothetical protein
MSTGSWQWLDYPTRLIGPDGTVYREHGYASPNQVKALYRGEAVLLEQVHSDRDVHLSERREDLVTAVRRGSYDAVIDPANGASGDLTELRSEADRYRRVLLLSWDC